VPEPTIPDDGRSGRALATAVEGAIGGGAKPITHGRPANLEGRQGAEQVTADVGG
jgi:hypothetical protein